MNLPNPAGQAQDPQTNPWKVLALVFGGILVYEGVSYYWNRERGRYARRNPASDPIGDAMWATAEYRVVSIGRKR